MLLRHEQIPTCNRISQTKFDYSADVASVDAYYSDSFQFSLELKKGNLSGVVIIYATVFNLGDHVANFSYEITPVLVSADAVQNCPYQCFSLLQNGHCETTGLCTCDSQFTGIDCGAVITNVSNSINGNYRISANSQKFFQIKRSIYNTVQQDTMIINFSLNELIQPNQGLKIYYIESDSGLYKLPHKRNSDYSENVITSQTILEFNGNGLDLDSYFKIGLFSTSTISIDVNLQISFAKQSTTDDQNGDNSTSDSSSAETEIVTNPTNNDGSSNGNSNSVVQIIIIVVVCIVVAIIIVIIVWCIYKRKTSKSSNQVVPQNVENLEQLPDRQIDQNNQIQNTGEQHQHTINLVTENSERGELNNDTNDSGSINTISLLQSRNNNGQRQMGPTDRFRNIMWQNLPIKKKLDLFELNKYMPEQVFYRKIENKFEAEECMICLEEYKPGDMIRKVAFCNHFLHSFCLSQWQAKEESCPICKQKLDLETLKTLEAKI